MAETSRQNSQGKVSSVSQSEGHHELLYPESLSAYKIRIDGTYPGNRRIYCTMYGSLHGTFLYKGEQVIIQIVKHYEDDLYDVYTDKRRIRLTKAEMRESFKPVHVPVRPNGHDQALIAVIKEEGKALNDLANKLYGMIDKIEQDETYVKRAKAINETARSIIGARRAQSELIKILRK